MIECSKLESGAQGVPKAAQTHRSWLDHGLALSPGLYPCLLVRGARAVAPAYQGAVGVGILSGLTVTRQTRLDECRRIAPNRHTGRIERAVTYSKQRIRVPSTRHKLEGGLQTVHA